MAWYFGSDLGTSNNPCGSSFYIGRLGDGINRSLDWNPPNNTAPTFTFWNIQGPTAAPSGTSITDWANQQADAYVYEWIDGISGYNLAHTLFGALSVGSGGWSTSTVSQNRELVNAFLDRMVYELQTVFGITASIGLYGSLSSEFGTLLDYSTWSPSQEIVVWLAKLTSGTCSEIESGYCQNIKVSIGGYFPMIWQYAQNPDYDVTPYGGGPNNGMWNAIKYPGIC